MTRISQTQVSSTILPLRRISTQQLRKGMFLTRVLDSWWKSPFFVHRRLLATQGDIQQLQDSGIKEVEIDVSKGVDVLEETEECSFGNSERIEGSEADSQPQMPVEEQGQENRMETVLEKSNKELGQRTVLQRLHEQAVAGVQRVFEGVKTGQPIHQPTLLETSRNLLVQAISQPVLMAEVTLLESLRTYQGSLYAHVVDTAIFSILVGMELGWEEAQLEELCLAALVHDVGFMRLPKNLVKKEWGGTLASSTLVKQHVSIGVALLKRGDGWSPGLLRSVEEHHEFQDGSGYQKLGREWLSPISLLLGLVDYFDEFMAETGQQAPVPAAIILRRLYQESKKGKFPPSYVEALIRVLGVYPIGTMVELSGGEQAVVVKPNPEARMQPWVKIIRDAKGTEVSVPDVVNLATPGSSPSGHSITKILEGQHFSRPISEYL